MIRLLILTLVFHLAACSQQTEQEQSINTDSDKQSVDSLRIGNVKSKEENSDSTLSKKQPKKTTIEFSNGPSQQKIELNEETIIVIQMDSLETEQLKRINGEDIFYTAADDLMWYNSMMLEKMDSLGIQVNYTEKDTVDFFFNNQFKRVVKDSTYSFYTYFRFDGTKIKRTELFELLDL